MSGVVVRQEESLEVTCYVHLLNSCKQDRFSVLSVLENLLVTMKLQNPGTKKVFLRLDEPGCYHNSKLYHPYESSDIAWESNSGGTIILSRRLEKIAVLDRILTEPGKFIQWN